METINEIAREMRERAVEIRASGMKDELSANVARLFEIDADRIETATKFVSSVAERADRDLAVLAAENADLRAAMKRLYVLAKNRMPSEPTLDEIESMCEAERILNESEVR